MIIIVGAGITGLSAAFELARRGLPFRVLEASPRAGGLIRTEHIDGYTIEAGPESVLAQKPAALELFEALGLSAQVVTSLVPRTAFILGHGRLHPLPSPSVLGIPTTMAGVVSYGLLPAAARARLAIEPWVPRRRSTEDESVGAFFRRRFGGATVGLIAEPLLGGIHSGNVERLSMRSLFPRFLDAEARRGSVLRAFRHAAAAGGGEGLFRSLDGGMGGLVEAIERQLPAGSVQCGAAVTHLERGGGDRPEWRVWTGDGEAAAADAVILTTPAWVTARLLEPIDDEAAALCAGITYVSSVSVSLAWPRAAVAHPLRGSGFVVARRASNLRITACTWVSSKWAGRAPAGMVLLRAFMGGAHDPEAVEMEDAAIVASVVRDLAAVLGIGGAPVLARVARWPRAGAQHEVGHAARVEAIERRLDRHPGVQVAGSGFHAVGLPDCITDGRAAAARAADCTMIGRTSPDATAGAGRTDIQIEGQE